MALKFKIIHLYFLGIIATLLSQLPIFIENGTTQYFQIVWILPIMGLFYMKHFRLNKVIVSLLIVTILLSAFVILMSFFNTNLYFKSPHLINIFKSLFILVISFNYSFFVDIDTFTSKIGWISFLLGSIICFSVYIQVLKSNIAITDRTYAYAAKNSVSQIIISCLIIAFFFVSNQGNLGGMMLKSLKLIFIAFGIYVIFILKSRATILGLFFFMWLIIKRKDALPKLFLVFVISLFGFILFFFNDLRNLLFYNIIFAGRDMTDFNDASSGRIGFISDFPVLFFENMFLGHGFIFNECFPLSVLLDYGILGGILVFYFAIIPIVYMKKMWTLRNYNLPAVFISLVLIYYFNSLFEQQAPFGPGAKNFFLWVFLGFAMNKCDDLYLQFNSEKYAIIPQV